MFRQYIALLLLELMFTVAVSQQTMMYSDKDRAFRQGMELFDEQNYLAAREQFELLHRQISFFQQPSNELLLQNTDYYIAVCAIKSGDKDAEKLLRAYFKNYPASAKRPVLNFYAGTYYYQHKDYTQAIDFFKQVNEKDLDNHQIYDYKFQLGYAYFTRKKFADAKPLFASIKAIKDKYYYPANYYYAFISFYNKDYSEALKTFTEIEDSKMYSSVIPYYIAQIYYYQKDYNRLPGYLTKNIGKEGVYYQPEMKFLLGETYYQLHEYDKALPLLKEYIDQNKSVEKGQLYMLAYCQYQTGDYKSAIENFQQLSLLNDTLAQIATYNLGDCYLKTVQKDKARSAFQSASGMNYDPVIQQNSLYNYGKLSFELGSTNEAMQSFETYLHDYPTGTYYNDVNEMLATALVRTRNYEKAYHLMEQMKLNSAMIQQAYQKVTCYRAIELYNDQKADEALDLCNKSLQYPLDLDIQALTTYLKAEILYHKEQYAQASELYKKFNAMASPTLEKTGEASKLRASYNIGYCYFKQKDYSNATIYFSDAVVQSENTQDVKGKQALLPDLYMRLGDCAFVTKNYPKAVDAYTTIVTNRWQGMDYAQYQKGIILGLQSKNDEKIQAMNYLITNFQGSNYADHAYYEIGETYLAAGNLAAARTAYQQVISKFPSSNLLPKCYLKTAVLDYNSGKKEAALQDYQDVVQRFPHSAEEKEALDALKQVYVELGRANDYFAFIKNSTHITISSSEQDSLTYQSALNAFNTGDCSRAITLFDDYLTKFANGYFVNDAYWKEYECYIKIKDFNAALANLDSITKNRYSTNYEDALLKASGIAFYELKDYQHALNDYSMLYTVSTSKANTHTALLGMFRCAVLLKMNEKIVEYADQLLNSGIATEADRQEAYYERGKAYYALGNKDFSMGSFNRVTEFPVSERCVEAKYMVAKILNENQQYQASLDTCYMLKTKYASYEDWVVKTFILMADNFYAQGNAFQARATLESIVNNYQGNQDILKEAKEKLEKIRTEELNKTILQKETMPVQDSLFMETDSLLKGKP